MVDSIKAERETVKLVQAQAEHEIRVLKHKQAVLIPKAKKAKFAPESVQKLIDVAVLEATKARDAKMNAEKIYQANQKEFLSAGNATEVQMYEDIKSAEALEHVTAKAEGVAKKAEAKLASALDEIERKRMSADIGVALIKEEVLLQRRLVHSTKQRIIHADVHIKVQTKTEKESAGSFLQGSRAQALMLREFHAVNRRWEDESIPAEKVMLENEARYVMWQLRDLGHDGGPNEQDVTLLQARENASRDHAFVHERTLTVAMAPLRNMVRTMKENLGKLVTNNQGSGHSHRTQYRRAIRVAEIKLHWAEEAQQKAQSQLAAADARLNEAQKRRKRYLKLDEKNGKLLDKLAKKVLADEAMMTSENEPKTALAISQFVNTEVTKSEGVVELNIRTAEGVEMVAAMGGGVAMAKKAAQDRARQSNARQVQMATDFTTELKMLSDKDKCKEKALIVAKFSAHKLEFKPGVFDCGWEGEKEMAKQETFLKNEIGYNNKELAKGNSAPGVVKLLNSANNRTTDAVVSMLQATEAGKQVIVAQAEVFEREQDFKRSKEKAEEDRIAELTGNKEMLAAALKAPGKRLGECLCLSLLPLIVPKCPNRLYLSCTAEEVCGSEYRCCRR